MTMETRYTAKVRRMVKVVLPFYLLAFLPLLVACDHIAEDDQLIEVENTLPVMDEDVDEDETPRYTARTVLLEDFTGQRCPNCPTGTEVIEELQESCGDRLIAVAIHGGPLGFKGTATVVGLATDLGDEYYNHWNLEYQPVGLINRGPATNYTDWVASVRENLGYVSEIKMGLSATLGEDKIVIDVQEENLGGDYSGKLQVWVLEDGITALQIMPDGSRNTQYVHNHVHRAAVNGAWGEDITLSERETKSQTMSQTLDASWNKDNLSVVAFVYNDHGVEQAVKAKVE
jgi:hypothetical protein